MDHNQESDEEIGENQSIEEELGEKQSSGEEMSQNQSSDEELGEEMSQNQSSEEETEVEERPRWLNLERPRWLNLEGPRCIISDPAQPHYLIYRAKSETKYNCFSCGEKDVTWKKPYGDTHYDCTVCNLEFHDRCVDVPSKMIHPFHPQHPLSLIFLNNKTGVIVNTNFREFVNTLDPEQQYNFDLIDILKYLQTFDPNSNIIFDKCTWCRKDLRSWFYRCSICNFSLDFLCALKTPPLTIQNPKSHHHSLVLFPQPLSFPCYACGKSNMLEASYACYQCNYFVHETCVDLPRVMKITRHPHRLSHIPFHPAKLSSCRVCYKNVDVKYGQYSCSQEDCSYVVHSTCATHEKIWGGEELEWEPEESDQTEDYAPYKNMGGDLIEHFSHINHYLRLKKYDGIRDPKRQCRACIRPIMSHDFYNCIECDFFLHQVCANLPKKLDHALHRHPLFLVDSSGPNITCSACSRCSTGFKYICKEYGCRRDFQLDINCVLVPECLTHKGHEEHKNRRKTKHEEHLLFISTCYSDDEEFICQSCKKRVRGDHLHCTLCEYVLCYKCATIPNEIYYKYDENPRSLCFGKSGVDDSKDHDGDDHDGEDDDDGAVDSEDGVYWCEVCEKTLDPTVWFYTNKERCSTIHHECLFGDTTYMKSGHKFIDYRGMQVQVISNGSSSRPICCVCHHHCPHPVYLKFYMGSGTFMGDYCSISCLSDRVGSGTFMGGY
ncbi:unnamed protein product [Microthlaspi erraticum]|uniref:Phorbol-ester/DAG-type domain-containing protein n=1 Tax=Microthlaspi erraticum TaxID=1685480 RepID=A0A6D2IK70_9BRAS|nr:unnamed protein product [Microthlaspi erraticum]